MDVEGSTHSLFFGIIPLCLDGTEENHRNYRIKPGLSEYREELLRTRWRGLQSCARNSLTKHVTNALWTKYEDGHMAGYLRKKGILNLGHYTSQTAI
jgi:hypothetical protein